MHRSPVLLYTYNVSGKYKRVIVPNVQWCQVHGCFFAKYGIKGVGGCSESICRKNQRLLRNIFLNPPDNSGTNVES